MAKQRLFPEPEKQSDTNVGTRENFKSIASKVFSVTKSEIDERDKRWREEHSRRKKRPV